jgi:cation transport regulator ChaC
MPAMPLYFAYGSNMDVSAMRSRCPKARPIGPARLARHRFVLMGRTGYASVHRDSGAEVHGVLFDLAFSDIPPLDRYEDVAHGLYVKAVQPVTLAQGGVRQALIYLGTDTTVGGRPPPGYMDDVVAAARAAGLPGAYVARLEALVSRAAAGHHDRRPSV